MQSAFMSDAGGQESPSRAREAAQGPEDGPEMGAQFAQLVKELRSEYGGAVQACAFRISQVTSCLERMHAPASSAPLLHT